MGSSSVKISLGSILLYVIISCTNNQQSKDNPIVAHADTCRTNLYDGELVLAKLGNCRSCHLSGLGPRFDVKTLTFNELSAVDSLKLSDYVFTKKHGGMFTENYPEGGKVIDSLSSCEKKNLIHLIKEAARNTPRP